MLKNIIKGMLYSIVLISMGFVSGYQYRKETAPKYNYCSKLTSYAQKYSGPERKEFATLALNILMEAGGEEDNGKFAVGYVTMNRLAAGYGKTVSEVVWQEKQFSWTNKGARGLQLVRNVTDVENFMRILEIADIVYTDDKGLYNNVKGFMHFCRKDIVKKVAWTKHYKERVIIGNHVFMKEKS